MKKTDAINLKSHGRRLAAVIGLLAVVLVFTAGPAMAFGSVGTGASKFVELSQKLDEAWEKTKPLDPGDGGNKPEYDPPGMPEVPVSCGDNNACWKCYKKANEKIEKLRVSFEKLRLLYKETDEFTKAALAFGDGVAGSTGVAALEWGHQRGNIRKSFKAFEAAYKKKYGELLDKLKAALLEVAECERLYFNEQDWYARYGYMFHTFMALNYQK